MFFKSRIHNFVSMALESLQVGKYDCDVARNCWRVVQIMSMPSTDFLHWSPTLLAKNRGQCSSLETTSKLFVLCLHICFILVVIS